MKHRLKPLLALSMVGFAFACPDPPVPPRSGPLFADQAATNDRGCVELESRRTSDPSCWASLEVRRNRRDGTARRIKFSAETVLNLSDALPLPILDALAGSSDTEPPSLTRDEIEAIPLIFKVIAHPYRNKYTVYKVILNIFGRRLELLCL